VLALALAFALAVPSCRKSKSMNADTLAGSAAPRAVPQVALGPDFAPVAFAPGRYATAIQRTLHGTHALQVLNEDSTSVFALELAADGTATACRGWRYVFRNDGPEVHTEDNYREQQGYRGRYAVVDGVAEVELALDNAVCGRVFEGGLALTRAPQLKLRCVLAAPQGATPLTAPVLLCRSAEVRPTELDAHVVEQLAPAGWFVLGSGNGLRVWVTGRPPGAQEGEDMKATVQAADAPLRTDAWEHPFPGQPAQP
jgi:hypothetical protein